MHVRKPQDLEGVKIPTDAVEPDAMCESLVRLDEMKTEQGAAPATGGGRGQVHT